MNKTDTKTRIKGTKFVHFSSKRDIDLEKELQQKLLTILNDPKYRKTPMLVMNALKVTQSKKYLLEVPKPKSGGYHFIITNNLLIGSPLEKKSANKIKTKVIAMRYE